MGETSTAMVIGLPLATEQLRVCEECRSLALTPTGAEMVLFGEGAGKESASNVLISGSPDAGGLWTP